MLKKCFFSFLGLTVREAAEEMIANARRFLELEMGVENIIWSKRAKQSQCQNSQNKNSSQRITSPLQIQATSKDNGSQQSSNLLNIKNDRKRKRKLDNDGSDSSEYLLTTGKQSGKKCRICPESEYDSKAEFSGEPFTYIRINSADSNMDTDDRQSELLDELTKYKELNIIDVFRSLEFFRKFEVTVKSSSIVSVSVGVNQLLKATPIIGSSSLMKQTSTEDENIESYNCTFDDNKFVAGISLCLSDNVVCYLNLQNETSDDVAITFDMKIKFLVDLFHMEDVKLVMYDAKEQCKVLVKCFPQLSNFSAQLRDPLVASWLLRPDMNRNLLAMVS